MSGFSRVKNRQVIGVKKKLFSFFQASRLLSCHFRLVLKLFSLLVQRFGNVCSKMRSMFFLNETADGS